MRIAGETRPTCASRPDFDNENNEKKTESGASIAGRREKGGKERERERERERDSFLAVSEQFKDTARTSSTRIKVAETGSGARRYVAQIHASVYF